MIPMQLGILLAFVICPIIKPISYPSVHSFQKCFQNYGIKMYMFQSQNKYLGNNRQIPKQKVVIISKYLPKIYLMSIYFISVTRKYFTKQWLPLQQSPVCQRILFFPSLSNLPCNGFQVCIFFCGGS